MRRFIGLIASLCLVTACATWNDGEPSAHVIEPDTTKRLLVDGLFGQVHVRIASPPANIEDKPALVLFHPTPYSSLFYGDYMAEMSKDRLVIAMDTPGYGASDRPSSSPSIADYAINAEQVLDALNIHEPVDVVGYHTGTLIAAELAIRSPTQVRRLILPGVPYFTGEAQKEALANYAKPDELKPDGSHLLEKWKFARGGMDYGMSIERAQEHFSDLAQALPFSSHAYYGVFSYPGEDRFPQLAQPVLYIAPEGSLLEETKAVHEITPNSQLVILTEYPHNVFDLGIPYLADLTRNFLDDAES